MLTTYLLLLNKLNENYIKVFENNETSSDKTAIIKHRHHQSYRSVASRERWAKVPLSTHLKGKGIGAVIANNVNEMLYHVKVAKN